MTEAHTSWLAAFITRCGGVAGTVHLLDGEVLRLVASQNIPPKVIAITGEIPKGKGMAGLAWERRRPVQTCNLKDDETGDVRPGAKAVDALAAVALPVLDGDEVVAVVGVAWGDERELDDAALETMARDAASVPRAD